MDFEIIKKEMLEKKNWAVVGVTEKKDRFGYKIWKILEEHNYIAHGVNPKYNEIDGKKIYSSIKDIPEKIDVVNMVVSPKFASGILDEAKELGIEYIFFQPGTYDQKIVKKARDLGFKYLIDDCIYAILKAKE